MALNVGLKFVTSSLFVQLHARGQCDKYTSHSPHVDQRGRKPHEDQGAIQLTWEVKHKNLNSSPALEQPRKRFKGHILDPTDQNEPYEIRGEACG